MALVAPRFLAVSVGVAGLVVACSTSTRRGLPAPASDPRPATSLSAAAEPSSPTALSSADASEPPAGPPGQLGSEATRAVLFSGAGGQWVAACQRSGDEKESPVLLLADGRSVAVDDILATGKTGEYVIVQRDGRMAAMSTRDARFTPLPGMPRGRFPGEARSRVVALRDRQVAYVVDDPPRSRLHWHRLGSGARGSTAIAGLARSLTLTRHHIQVTLARGPVGSMPAEPVCPPRPGAVGNPRTKGPVHTVLVPRVGGPPRTIAGFVAAMGQSWLERRGRAWFLTDGRQSQLYAEAGCAPRLVHRSERHGGVLLTCREGRFREPLRFMGLDFAIGLLGDAPPDTEDRSGSGDPRLVPVYPGAEAFLADFRERRVHRLARGDKVAATWRGKYLIRRLGRLALGDVDDGALKDLGPTAPLPMVRRRGAWAFVEPYLVHLTSGEVRRLASTPLALASDGRVLQRVGVHPQRGPLRWE